MKKYVKLVKYTYPDGGLMNQGFLIEEFDTLTETLKSVKNHKTISEWGEEEVYILLYFGDIKDLIEIIPDGL